MLLVLLAATTAANPALMSPLWHAYLATRTMSSQIIAVFLALITVFRALKPPAFVRVAQANFTFLSRPGLANPAPQVLKFARFQQSSNVFLDTTWSTQSVSTALLTAKHAQMPTLAQSVMLAITSQINKHALFVLFRTVRAATKVDNASYARIIVTEPIVTNFVHLFAKYATVKYAINALLAIISAQQALAKH